MNYNAGDILDDYKLLYRCGQGAYGTVFLAENQMTTRRVALKIVYKRGLFSERELKGLQQYKLIAEKTNLLQIYQVKEYDDFFYYTMDAADNLIVPNQYIPDTLGNRLKNGPLAPDAVRKMAVDLQENLQELHRKGLFHRDIKPDNILFINNRAVLGDIGLVTDNALTVLAGTPGFIPAEVLAGLRNYEAADDYYALGKVIYCALTGAPVSNYPSFPDNCTITDSGDLIKLYNKYCSGKKPESPQPAARRWYYFIPYAAMLLLLVAFVAIETDLLPISNIDAPVENGALPELKNDKKAVRKADAGQQLNIKSPPTTVRPGTRPGMLKPESMSGKCYDLLQGLLLEYVPPQNIMAIYPELQRIYYKDIAAKRKAGIALERDEALLEKYFMNEQALTELLENIKLSIDEHGVLSDDDKLQLARLQTQRQQLDFILGKRYSE